MGAAISAYFAPRHWPGQQQKPESVSDESFHKHRFKRRRFKGNAPTGLAHRMPDLKRSL
jgi:hypothetical protein